MIKKLRAEILLAIEGRKEVLRLYKLSWIEWSILDILTKSCCETRKPAYFVSGAEVLSIERRTGARAAPGRSVISPRVMSPSVFSRTKLYKVAV